MGRQVAKFQAAQGTELAQGCSCDRALFLAYLISTHMGYAKLDEPTLTLLYTSPPPSCALPASGSTNKQGFLPQPAAEVHWSRGRFGFWCGEEALV